MTWPEDAPLHPHAPGVLTKAPSAALGYLLNILLPGAGFTLINRWGWHLGWFGILLVLNIGAPVLFSLDSPLSLILPVTGFLAMLFHFGRMYAEQKRCDFQPPLELPIKLFMMLGHFLMVYPVLGIFIFVISSTF